MPCGAVGSGMSRSCQDGLVRHRVEAGRPHTRHPSLSLFIFSNGNNEMYLYVCYGDETDYGCKVTRIRSDTLLGDYRYCIK